MALSLSAQRAKLDNHGIVLQSVHPPARAFLPSVIEPDGDSLKRASSAALCADLLTIKTRERAEWSEAGSLAESPLLSPSG